MFLGCVWWVTCKHSSAHQSKYGWLPLAAWSCHVYSSGNASEDKKTNQSIAPKYWTGMMTILHCLNQQNSSMSRWNHVPVGKPFTHTWRCMPSIGITRAGKQARSSNSMYITAAYVVWMSLYNDHVPELCVGTYIQVHVTPSMGGLNSFAVWFGPPVWNLLSQHHRQVDRRTTLNVRQARQAA